VLPAEKLVDYFGPKSFDIVMSTEVVEHVLDWGLVISTMKAVLRRVASYT
jgi:2-polyprenyl-3-methyl-5-hydroxy-6-metoxy-1,4-benzoquinol methylase